MIYNLFKNSTKMLKINPYVVTKHKKRTAAGCGSPKSIAKKNYSAEGAETGHTSAQAPQSMQVSASISYFPSPSEIAVTGHPSAQAPQLMQASEIL